MSRKDVIDFRPMFRQMAEDERERKANRDAQKNIRCNNCDTYFHDDHDLEKVREEESGDVIDACPVCKTDAYLMDLRND